MVSWIIAGEADAATTRAVLTLPVRDSLSSMVRAESRNGMYPPLVPVLIMATMRPNADRDVLMFFASSARRSRELMTPDFAIRSLPARSATMNLELRSLVPYFWRSFRVMTQCERLERSFKAWPLAVRVASTVCMIERMSSGLVTSRSFVPLIS